MKLVFERPSKTYTAIRNLSFDPEIDLTGQELIVNGFTVEIETDDNISSGQRVLLEDNLNNIWVRYWVIKTERKQKNFITVEAKSMLYFLDRYSMKHRFYDNIRLDTALLEIFNTVGETLVDLRYANTEIPQMRINGYCPTQTARERLQSILMATGTYISEYMKAWLVVTDVPNLGTSVLDDDYGTIIEANSVFMKPKLISNDAVSALHLTYYSVTAYDSGSGKTIQDEDGGTYWYETGGGTASSSGTGNYVDVKDNMMVDYTSYQTIFDNLIAYYISRTDRVEADVINNGIVFPGTRVLLPFDIESGKLVMGYVRAVDFTYGNQIRSKLSIFPAMVIDGAKVTLKYVCNGETVHTEIKLYTIGYLIEIHEGQIQVLTNGHLRTYEHIYVSGEATRGGIIEIPCDLISDQNLITGETTYPTSGEVTEE